MNKDLLISAQKEYIEFLAEEVSRLSQIVVSHPYMAAPQEIIEKGKELRDKIKQYEV